MPYDDSRSIQLRRSGLVDSDIKLVRKFWIVLVRNSFEGLGPEHYIVGDRLVIPGNRA